MVLPWPKFLPADLSFSSADLPFLTLCVEVRIAVQSGSTSSEYLYSGPCSSVEPVTCCTNQRACPGAPSRGVRRCRPAPLQCRARRDDLRLRAPTGSGCPTGVPGPSWGAAPAGPTRPRRRHSRMTGRSRPRQTWAASPARPEEPCRARSPVAQRAGENAQRLTARARPSPRASNPRGHGAGRREARRLVQAGRMRRAGCQDKHEP